MEHLIFNIKRFAVHDGPGIRTTVFFKGCPLHCPWCHNPESLDNRKNIVYDSTSCIKCHLCVENCPSGAIALLPTQSDILINIDKNKCSLSARCIEICPTKSLKFLKAPCVLCNAHTVIGRQLKSLYACSKIC